MPLPRGVIVELIHVVNIGLLRSISCETIKMSLIEGPFGGFQLCWPCRRAESTETSVRFLVIWFLRRYRRKVDENNKKGNGIACLWAGFVAFQAQQRSELRQRGIETRGWRGECIPFLESCFNRSECQKIMTRISTSCSDFQVVQLLQDEISHPHLSGSFAAWTL